MKKYTVIPFVIALTFFITIFNFSFTASAQENQEYTLIYTLDEDGTAKITGYEGHPIHLVIPSEIDGYRVTSVYTDAFAVNAEELYYDANCYCPVKNLVIEEGVTFIRPGAFKNCRNLQSVSLPESLERIDFDAFLGCDALSSMTFPKNISFIDSDAVGYSYISNFSPNCWEYEWWGEPMKHFTIYGYADTIPEIYANKNGFTFIPLDEQLTTTTTSTAIVSTDGTKTESTTDTTTISDTVTTDEITTVVTTETEIDSKPTTATTTETDTKQTTATTTTTTTETDTEPTTMLTTTDTPGNITTESSTVTAVTTTETDTTLPQTGYSKWYQVIAGLAVCMTGIGGAMVIGCGKLKKKKR
mgnify:CR=1 FL=1